MSVDTKQLDKYIQTLANIQDKKIDRGLRKMFRKATSKALTYVKRVAKGNAKSRNNGLNDRSYLSTYKKGKLVHSGSNWRVRIYNKNGKAHFLEKPRFHHHNSRKGINALEQSKDNVNSIFVDNCNNLLDDILKELGK